MTDEATLARLRAYLDMIPPVGDTAEIFSEWDNGKKIFHVADLRRVLAIAERNLNAEKYREALSDLSGWGTHDEGCRLDPTYGNGGGCNCGFAKADRRARKLLGTYVAPLDPEPEDSETLLHALTEIREALSFEINLANYDTEDVERLNAASITAHEIADGVIEKMEQGS